MSEVSQAEKDEHHMVSLICDILKNGKNKLIYKTESQMYKTNMVAKGGRGKGQSGRVEAKRWYTKTHTASHSLWTGQL